MCGCVSACKGVQKYEREHFVVDRFWAIEVRCLDRPKGPSPVSILRRKTLPKSVTQKADFVTILWNEFDCFGLRPLSPLKVRI